MSFFTTYWVLPLLFIFHDFEELVCVPKWLKNHDSQILGRTLFGGVARSDVLAIGIWEEFCIFIVVAIIAYWRHSSLIIVAATIPYLIHLVMHCLFVLLKGAYVPGVVTALIELPLVISYLMVNASQATEALVVQILVIIMGVMTFCGNLAVIHWGMIRLKAYF